MHRKYLPSEIEGKWQEKWKKEKTFSPDLDKAKNPYYALMMFPYPSAEGLHVGNMYAFTGTDIFARFMRMQGYDVLEPIGLDGFGIHSENYAMKINKHPMDQSKVTEERFYKQLSSIGNAFDWERTVETYKPEYYKWTQWIFLQMYKKGLAYKKKADVNWCPSCKTVLADEQVISGKCERCSSVVEKKQLEQWFFKITDYADRLLNNLKDLDWSEKVTIAQRNWIGKSEGMHIMFDSIEVFTTKPETIDGATFLVIAPDHPLVDSLTTADQRTTVQQYQDEVKAKSEDERRDSKEKTGVFTGSYVTNPYTKKKIPVWIADYVLMGYGTGAIMAVPDGDERDRAFAEVFRLPIEQTTYKSKPEGKKQVNYHLRDWLISRQRYWGPPIPIIYCDHCGVVPVPEKDLPVTLPYVENFRPEGTGMSPLASDPAFYNVPCPTCGKPAKRETDVSDTFLDSAWYFLRYTSTEDDQQPWKPERVKRWLPVSSYIGGAEHSVLHLLYSRFTTMVFKDMGLIEHFEEPFTRFRAHGLIISEGAKMSKSKGNVINPDDYIKEYGADTLRVYLMFLGPFDQGGDFRDQAISGPYNFLKRVWDLQKKLDNSGKDEVSDDARVWMQKTINKVKKDCSELKFNTAIAAMMEWINYLVKSSSVSVVEYKNLLLLLAPFAPHVTEELWAELGEKSSIHLQLQPKEDLNVVSHEHVRIAVQVMGKTRAVLSMSQSELEEANVVEKALSEGSVTRHIGEQKYKVIYVKGKVLNFVFTS